MPVEPTPKLPNLVAMPAKSPDLYLYIIDQTAEAGKTYRYRITYKALNPLLQQGPSSTRRPKKPGMGKPIRSGIEAQQLFPGDRRSHTNLVFLRPGRRGTIKPTFPFEVFTWTAGKWQKGIFNASLGDPIGGIDGGIDYSTGWTFVDRRSAKKPRNSSRWLITTATWIFATPRRIPAVRITKSQPMG